MKKNKQDDSWISYAVGFLISWLKWLVTLNIYIYMCVNIYIYTSAKFLRNLQREGFRVCFFSWEV